ncbi:MAG: enoyl-CoA hydratase/isomerase family protein [SAR202 cluster bacterium]|jgi:enoyl-CoA hydratase/carnithine racemase|nr:enoyl-CoA hydratase/isomerase family protein [SAR202 cluster bacterium]MQG52681.1 enoyl-CoA hydratase/isomerase family protein [SAR202 cluster bacterium]|tara:strand:+ start:5388 stop:6062 length:675 start_codon:yes stop_codon:yes gene_type:complete
MNYQAVKVAKESATLSITLNRPTIGNAFNTVMRDELFSVFELIEWDTEIHSVLLYGSGKNFCTGADLTEFGTSPSLVQAREIRKQRDLWTLMMKCPVPIISAIQGKCIGSGVEIALLSDIRIATEDAEFMLPEPRLGLIPAAGGTQTVPRTVNQGHAFELLLTGNTISSDVAHRIGLVSRVVKITNLTKEAFEVTNYINKTPRHYLSLLKELIYAQWTGQSHQI